MTANNTNQIGVLEWTHSFMLKQSVKEKWSLYSERKKRMSRLIIAQVIRRA